MHLHELGGVDTVGVAAALHALDVTQVWSTPATVGTGTIRTAHGELPSPAPATVALLTGAQVTGAGPAGETVTPTGAALLRAAGCRYGPMPPMRIVASGYGAGSREVPGRPNVLPVLLGEPLPGLDEPDGGGTGTLLVVETTVDDVTGELLGRLPGQLIGDGALDAWISPVTGKKGRPGHVVTALCPPATADAVEARLLRQTGSLGARRHQVQRRALPRTAAQVVVAGQRIRVKVGPHRAKPEHDDVVAAARVTGVPARLVAERAVTEFHRQPGDPGDPGEHGADQGLGPCPEE